MATDQMQVKTASIPKYEAQFEQQLRRAVGRVRFLDVTAALLALAAGTLLYALLVIGLDRWLILSGGARQFALIFYLVAGAAFIGYCIVRPMLRAVNPYYAAKRLEQTIPEAKNSVVNWLDLRNLELPGAIRAAVGQRAAQDAVRADLDAAISGKRAAWAGGGTGVLFVVLLVTLGILGPSQFWSLLGRAFGPFTSGGIRTRTQIELRQPQGDAVVPVGNSVAFAATITGKVPAAGRAEAPRLLFRYRSTDPYEERPLERERDSDYATTLPANQVHGGFWYKIAAGDAETDEYQVRVRATPLIDKIDVIYHYRPYLGWKDQTISDPNIQAVRGTEVVVTAYANRAVRAAQCDITGKENYQLAVPGEPVPDNANAMQFKFALERDGQYRITFSSQDGDSSGSSIAYSIQVLPDRAPHVELKKPGTHVTLPANGLLQLEGSANDDLGVESMTLRMRVAGGPVLQPRPYRGGKSFKLPDGGYPKMLQYKDAVELDKLKDDLDKPFPVAPKMVLEYWLEAADACDFPEPNVGKSELFKVTIGEPDKDQQKQQQDRKQAAKDQQNHEQKQDKDLAKENQTNKEGNSGEKNGEPKEGGDKNPKEQNTKDGSDSKTEQLQDQLEKELQKQDDRMKSEPKSDGANENKQPQGGKDGENNQPQAGTGKDKGKPEKPEGSGSGQDGKEEPGQDKSEGAKQDGTGGEKSDAKKPNPNGGKQDQSTAKPEAGEGQPNPGEKKEQAQPQGTKPEKGNGKGSGQPGTQPETADAKGQGGSKEGQKPDQGTGKGPGNPELADKHDPAAATKPGDQPPATSGKQDDGKGPQASGQQNAKKPDGPEKKGAGSSNTGEPNKDPKNQGGAGAGTKTGDPKDPNKNESGGTGNTGPKKDEPTSTPKPGTGSNGEKQGEKATPEEVAKLADQMKQGDGQKQEDAAKKLAEVTRNAKDAKAREEARNVLEQADRDTGTGEPNPAASKEGPKKEGQHPPQGQGTADTKKQPEKKDPQTGDVKNETGKQQGEKSEQKNGPKSPGTGNDQGTEERTDGDPNGPAKGKSRGEPGKPTKGVPGGNRKNDESGNETPPDLSGTKPDPRDQLKKGELLLERFDKMLQKEKEKFLQDAKISEEDMKRFREDIARRKARMVEKPEKVAPATGQGSRQDAGVSRVGSGGRSRAADTQYGGPGSPPPEFRETYREFTSGKEKK